MNSILTLLLENVFKAWKSGNKSQRRIIRVSIGITLVAIIFALISTFAAYESRPLFESIASVLGAIAALLALGVSSYYEVQKKEEEKEKIQTLEKEIKDNPTETKTAWELARLKLESYLNRNLKQVSSIFYLSLFVMLVGFGLILFGVYKSFEDEKLLQPSILVAASGLIVNFIGATFLIVYKSTMNQAKNYVEVLERINAVGMSIQILESIDESQSDLRDQTTADIAKDLLKIYGNKRVCK